MKRLLIALCLISFMSGAVHADDSPEGVIKGTGGVLLGTPIGFVTGLVRGSASEAHNFREAIQDGFGAETTASKIVSYPLGYFSGGIVGAFAGAVKGVYNGIYYGVKDPFSQESFSVDGNFDNFRTFDYSKANYGSL